MKIDWKFDNGEISTVEIEDEEIGGFILESRKSEDNLERKEAKDFFLEALKATEGSERERYATIYTKLILGKNYCTDELD